MKRQDRFQKRWMVVMLMLSTMLISLPAYAGNTALQSPASYATGTTGNPATNPQQALVEDVITGTVNDSLCAWFRTNNPGGGGDVADSQIYYDFSLAVPAGATINGIEVVVSGYRTGTPSVGAYFEVRLNGGAGWTAYKDTSVFTTVDAEYTLGNSTDQWGGTWIADNFSNVNFRLEVLPAGPTLNGELWKLDSVRVMVYYTLADFEGLSHGYWKNHPDDWPATGYSPSQTLGSVFSASAALGLSAYTLDQALDFKGGSTLQEKAQILLRNAVAALLNAAHPNINYPLTVAEVIAEVDTALAGDAAAMEALENLLDGYNNLGADLES